MCYEFACGDIAKAKQCLAQVLNLRSSDGSSDFASVDSAVLDGYCQAFALKPANNADPIVAPITEQVLNAIVTL